MRILLPKHSFNSGRQAMLQLKHDLTAHIRPFQQDIFETDLRIFLTPTSMLEHLQQATLKKKKILRWWRFYGQKARDYW